MVAVPEYLTRLSPGTRSHPGHTQLRGSSESACDSANLDGLLEALRRVHPYEHGRLVSIGLPGMGTLTFESETVAGLQNVLGAIQPNAEPG